MKIFSKKRSRFCVWFCFKLASLAKKKSLYIVVDSLYLLVEHFEYEKYFCSTFESFQRPPCSHPDHGRSKKKCSKLCASCASPCCSEHEVSLRLDCYRKSHSNLCSPEIEESDEESDFCCFVDVVYFRSQRY